MIVIIIIAALSTRIPLIGKYISVIHTMIHESGHAILTLLMNGHVHKIELFTNTEGTTFTSNSFWLSKVITSLAGYVFSSVTAYTFIILLARGQYKWVLWALRVFATMNLLLWVRNVYGIFWLISFLIVLYLLLHSTYTLLLHDAVCFFAGVILANSIISAFHIFKISITRPGFAGDATNLSKATYIPATVWGFFFFAQALWFAWLSVKVLIPIIL